MSLVIAASVASGGWWLASSGSDPPASDAMVSEPSTPAAAASTPAWEGLLDALSQRRSAAWRRSRPDLLERVFLAGSVVLAQDRRALNVYRRRELAVDSARVRFGRVTGVRFIGHARVRLTALDRLEPVVVRTRDGLRRDLPRDRASRHTIELQRTDRGWRIASITDARG